MLLPVRFRSRSSRRHGRERLHERKVGRSSRCVLGPFPSPLSLCAVPRPTLELVASATSERPFVPRNQLGADSRRLDNGGRPAGLGTEPAKPANVHRSTVSDSVSLVSPRRPRSAPLRPLHPLRRPSRPEPDRPRHALPKNPRGGDRRSDGRSMPNTPARRTSARRCASSCTRQARQDSVCIPPLAPLAPQAPH